MTLVWYGREQSLPMFGGRQGPHVDEALGESRPAVHFAQHFGDLDVGHQRIDLLGKGDRGWRRRLLERQDLQDIIRQ
jgi:hypothetical protein